MASYEGTFAIELNSPLSWQFTFLVLLKKYNFFGVVHEPILMQSSVQEVANLGDMRFISAHTEHRVFAREVTCRVGLHVF